MSKFKTDVQPKDIKLITDLLQSQPVNELYLKLKHLRDYGGTHKEIESAWKSQEQNTQEQESEVGYYNDESIYL